MVRLGAELNSDVVMTSERLNTLYPSDPPPPQVQAAIKKKMEKQRKRTNEQGGGGGGGDHAAPPQPARRQKPSQVPQFATTTEDRASLEERLEEMMEGRQRGEKEKEEMADPVDLLPIVDSVFGQVGATCCSVRDSWVHLWASLDSACECVCACACACACVCVCVRVLHQVLQLIECLATAETLDLQFKWNAWLCCSSPPTCVT